METWPQRVRMIEFLKKWWKLLAGFIGAIIIFFFGTRNRNQQRKFYENSKKNLEGQIEAEKTASKKLENEKKIVDNEFSKAMEKLSTDIREKKEKLNSDRKLEKDRVKDSAAKAIADMFDAEHIEIEEE